jgi:Spy/CpxP family protein refolding chaperone
VLLLLRRRLLVYSLFKRNTVLLPHITAKQERNISGNSGPKRSDSLRSLDTADDLLFAVDAYSSSDVDNDVSDDVSDDDDLDCFTGVTADVADIAEGRFPESLAMLVAMSSRSAASTTAAAAAAATAAANTGGHGDEIGGVADSDRHLSVFERLANTNTQSHALKLKDKEIAAQEVYAHTTTASFHNAMHNVTWDALRAPALTQSSCEHDVQLHSKASIHHCVLIAAQRVLHKRKACINLLFLEAYYT